MACSYNRLRIKIGYTGQVDNHQKSTHTMQLTIENIGLIRQAQIQINGLTVIAGANDSGKSTVGKVIFSLVKAIQRYQDDLEQGKPHQLDATMRKVYVALRQKVDFSEYKEIRRLFFPPTFLRELQQVGARAFDKRKELVSQDGKLDFVTPLLHDLEQVFHQDEDKDQAIQQALKNVLYSEFMGDFRRKDMDVDALSKLELKEGDNILFKATLGASQINTQLFDELIYQDATFIETPYVLNIPAVIRGAQVSFEDSIARRSLISNPNIALHIKDLNDKLREGGLLMGELDFKSVRDHDTDIKTIEKIFQALEGSFFYDEETDNFLFKKGDHSYKALNLASGVKSFGLLQLLEKGGFLRQGNIVIIDEPEVHLHPKWQLLYAEIIICLVQQGAHVIVTTHSPYILEALELYSKKLPAEVVQYYYASVDNGTVFENVTSHLDCIYQSLAEPFVKLENYSLTSEGGFEW